MLLLLLILISVYLVHLYLKQKHSVWKNQGIKGPTPIPLVGNIISIILQIESIPEYIMKIYKQYPDEDLIGIYRGYEPVIVIKNPELVKHILTKDFDMFKNRGLTPARGNFNINLVVAENETWQILRQNLTPVFTLKKIKDMFSPLEKSTNSYINYIEQMLDTSNEFEIRHIMEKYTMQATTCCVFGVDINPFKEKGNEFLKSTKKLISPTFTTKVSLMVDALLPGIRKYLYTNIKGENAFSSLVTMLIEEKTKQPLKNNDFLDLILHHRQRGKLNRRGDEGTSELILDDELMVGQVAGFYFAGVDTTSWLIAYILHELSMNEAIQNRLYEEICEVTKKYKDQLSFEAINEMRYLDMVFYETLRKYPVVPTIFRRCAEDYTIPGSGKVIPKDTSVIISSLALQNDPKYIKNPEVFDPENFSPENRKNIPHCVYLAFGEGPRNCIGKRFSVVMTKIAIVTFMKKFKVSPSRKTKLEFNYEIYTMLLAHKDGMWLQVSKR